MVNPSFAFFLNFSIMDLVSRGQIIGMTINVICCGAREGDERSSRDR